MFPKTFNRHSAKIRKKKKKTLKFGRCRKSGNHQKEYLAKSGYKPEIKYKSLIILLFFWLNNENQI
jgi:hypothetical protein